MDRVAIFTSRRASDLTGKELFAERHPLDLRHLCLCLGGGVSMVADGVRTGSSSPPTTPSYALERDASFVKDAARS